MLYRIPNRLLHWYVLTANNLTLRFQFIIITVKLDVPTSKFGEALRGQVEERLNFFETGAPPSKNSDAIRKVLDQLAMDEDDENDEMDADGPLLTTLEHTPSKDKKKRKSEAMGNDDDEEGSVTKKPKLSKEEKKALKKAAKKAAAEVSLTVNDTAVFIDVHNSPGWRGSPEKKGEEREEREEQEKGIVRAVASFCFVSYCHICCLSHSLCVECIEFSIVVRYSNWPRYKNTYK